MPIDHAVTTFHNKTIDGNYNVITNVSLSGGVTGTLPLANGGTGAVLVDPNADRIMFWDDSAGAVDWLTASTGLTISGTALTVNWASPGNIGSTAPATGNFTTLSAETSFTLTRSGNTPTINLTRSDTHGDAASLSEIAFFGVDSGAASQKYASIFVKATLDNAGAEEGELELSVVTGGAITEIVSITGTGLTATAGTFTGAVSGATVAGNMVATQANMETGTATNLVVSPGRQHFHPAHAKAWAFVSFSAGTPSYSAQYGFTGTPTDNGAGDTLLTMSTAMSSTNYAIIGSQEGLVAGSIRTARTNTTTINIRTYDNANALADSNFFVAVYGDQ
jgi:hypothetical protein